MGGSVPSSPSGPAPPALKGKKSMDWLSKGFKRKGSSSSSASSISDRRAGGETLMAHSSSYSSNLLAIPGSPAAPLYSPTDSSDDGASSRSEAGPHTPEGSIHSMAGVGISALDTAPYISSVFQASSGLPAIDTSVSQDFQNMSLSPPGSRSGMLKTPTMTPGRSSPCSAFTMDDMRTPMLGSAVSATGKFQSERDVEESAESKAKLIASVSSRKALRTMLDDPVGLWKFGQFLASEMNAETLVFWLNAEQHRNDLKRLYALTQKIHTLHIPSHAPMALNITSNERASIERSIRSFTKVDDPYKVARDVAFHTLYADAWPRFLQWRLELLQMKMRSGRANIDHTSFTLADPSQDRDQPLLLVSDGFLELSGYTRDDVLMRNCRFMQGPGTSPAVIARIRQACRAGTGVTELLLNYRKDGVPFWSLLRVIPLRNASGRLKYLLGAQINVTSSLAATKDLAHLLADDLDPVDMPSRPPFEDEDDISQSAQTTEAMKSYLTSLDKHKAEPLHEKSEAERRNIATKNSLNSPSLHKSESTSSSRSSETSTPASPARPRSANTRDMHLNAAAALAGDGGFGGGRPLQSATSMFGVANARPTTTGSLFARPGTAYSMIDNEGKAQVQVSLAEQTKALNESSSHYIILDSQSTMVLFHSPDLPASIHIGADFTKLVGSKVSITIKQTLSTGARIALESVSFDISSAQDPLGIWRKGVQLSVTPLKDQINETGAVVVLVAAA